MSKLYQIALSDGMSYVIREKDWLQFFSQKFYKITSGCLIVSRDQQNVQLFDLTKNEHVSPPIIQVSNIVRIQRVIEKSGLEDLYTKATSKTSRIIH
jgi:hypothetical protein